MSKEDMAVILFLLGLSMFAGCCCGSKVATRYQQRLAIESGTGRWTVDAKTGETTFVCGSAE